MTLDMIASSSFYEIQNGRHGKLIVEFPVTKLAHNYPVIIRSDFHYVPHPSGNNDAWEAYRVKIPRIAFSNFVDQLVAIRDIHLAYLGEVGSLD